MKLLVLLLASVGLVSARRLFNDAKLQCHEHSYLSFDKASKWEKRYDMITSPSGFIIKNFHFSTQIFRDVELGRLEKELAVKYVHMYNHLLNIKTPGITQKFRRTNYVLIWHFYHGHGATFYNLNPETKELKTVDLRKQRDVHFAVVLPNTWYAIDYPDDGLSTFSMLGLMSIRSTPEVSTLEFGNRDSLLKDFPMHRDVINKIMK